MLQFLAAAAPYAAQALPIISSLFANNNAKKGRDLVVNMGPTQAESRANALFEALLQPNNSLVRQQQDEGARLGIEGLLTQIRAMTNADRRRTARGGRGSLVDPERRDEFLDYSLSRGLPYIQQQALNDARTNIGNQAAGIKGFIPYQTDRQNAAKNAELNYLQYKNTSLDKGVGMLVDLLKKVPQSGGWDSW